MPDTAFGYGYIDYTATETPDYMAGDDVVAVKERYLFCFENGWGASVIRGPYSYGWDRGFWELAVWHGPWMDDDSHVCYQSDVTSDVIGWLDDREVKLLLDHISTMPYADWRECEDHDLTERSMAALRGGADEIKKYLDAQEDGELHGKA